MTTNWYFFLIKRCKLGNTNYCGLIFIHRGQCHTDFSFSGLFIIPRADTFLLTEYVRALSSFGPHVLLRSGHTIC